MDTSKLKIQRWVKQDSALENCTTVENVLRKAAMCLDGAAAYEIVGDCLFQADDGKYYCGHVEFVLDEADDDYVRESLKELSS